MFNSIITSGFDNYVFLKVIYVEMYPSIILSAQIQGVFNSLLISSDAFIGALVSLVLRCVSIPAVFLNLH